MNTESIVLITKDAMCSEYLPTYGNQYWAGKTPNIDQLAQSGTVHTDYFTAAPSSAMAYLSMFTGKYPFEQDISTYRPLTKQYSGMTLFDKAHDLGFDCHVIWDDTWMANAYNYSECYGQHTQMHALHDLRQGVGAHYKHDGFLQSNNEKSMQTLGVVDNAICDICKTDKKIFIWLHLPHVINGRTSYGGDIDLFDDCVGILRKYFSDNNIIISADHGNMNGHKGKLCYGFDVYDPAIRIPLITPKMNNLSIGTQTLCCIDLFDIIFNKILPTHDYVLSDSAYYAQKNRKLAIVKGKYRYIYNKATKTEELYDTNWDPNQQFNIISDQNYDTDRHISAPSRELYFYSEWDSLNQIRSAMREIKNEMWRTATAKQFIVNGMRDLIRPVYEKVSQKKQ